LLMYDSVFNYNFESIHLNMIDGPCIIAHRDGTVSLHIL